MISEADETCDPFLENCRTPAYVYEEKCGSCSGTGAARLLARRRGGHSSHRRTLSTCCICHGLGYVRVTTTSKAASMAKDVHVLGRSEPGDKDC